MSLTSCTFFLFLMMNTSYTIISVHRFISASSYSFFRQIAHDQKIKHLTACEWPHDSMKLREKGFHPSYHSLPCLTGWLVTGLFFLLSFQAFIFWMRKIMYWFQLATIAGCSQSGEKKKQLHVNIGRTHAPCRLDSRSYCTLRAWRNFSCHTI